MEIDMMKVRVKMIDLLAMILRLKLVSFTEQDDGWHEVKIVSFYGTTTYGKVCGDHVNFTYSFNEDIMRICREIDIPFTFSKYSIVE